MPASDARKLANQANSLKSTGPKTVEGKERSRANAYKHGMTGAGVVLPNEDAAEVERRFAAYEVELKPSGEIGRDLVRRAAICAVRMERGVSQETAALAERVRQAEADFVAPEGLDEATVAQLRAEAGARAMFDPSKEACLARKYEAAAERGFFRALKELRQLEEEAPAPSPTVEDEAFQETLASFFQMEQRVSQQEARLRELDAMPPSNARNRLDPGYQAPIDGIFDVPIAIGRAR